MKKERFQELAGIKNRNPLEEKPNLKKIIRESLRKYLKEEEDEEEIEGEEEEQIEGEDEIEAPAPDTTDPIQGVQTALTQAQQLAADLDDDVLSNQIGNTITYFVRNHVAKIADEEEEAPETTFPLDDVEVED